MTAAEIEIRDVLIARPNIKDFDPIESDLKSLATLAKGLPMTWTRAGIRLILKGARNYTNSQ